MNSKTYYTQELNTLTTPLVRLLSQAVYDIKVSLKKLSNWGRMETDSSTLGQSISEKVAAEHDEIELFSEVAEELLKSIENLAGEDKAEELSKQISKELIDYAKSLPEPYYFPSYVKELM